MCVFLHIHDCTNYCVVVMVRENESEARDRDRWRKTLYKRKYCNFYQFVFWNSVILLFVMIHLQGLQSMNLWAEEMSTEVNLVMDIVFLLYYKPLCTCSFNHWKELFTTFQVSLSLLCYDIVLFYSIDFVLFIDAICNLFCTYKSMCHYSHWNHSWNLFICMYLSSDL